MYKPFLLAFILVAGFSCASCSSGPDAGDAKTSARQNSQYPLVEPCELITKNDAASLLGEPVKDAEKSKQKAVGMMLCLYNPVDDNSMRFLQITLTQPAAMPPNDETPSSIFHDLKDGLSEKQIALEGVGDEAFIATGGLYLLEGEYSISIGSGNIDRPDVQERLKAAAGIALDNLANLKQ